MSALQQSDFTAALFDPALPCPAGLRAWNGSDPAALVAKTDSSFLRSVEWQSGHSGMLSARTSVSNSLAQCWQAYSYIGMGFSSSWLDFAAGGR